VTQPDRNPAVPHELLLGQAGFLRRLARDLVRDPHAAEDAVQDAWVAALEHPPRHDGNVRAWLGTILKNLVVRRAQASDRRVHHETRAAREGDGPSTPNASGESVRFVTDAVLALEEPYQSTILAHYFEDLSPSEIAKRQSVPVATVKSRLRRALEMLRAHMKREHGSGWAHVLVVLVAPKTIGKGALLVSLKTKITIGSALVLAAWFVAVEVRYTPLDSPASGAAVARNAVVENTDTPPDAAKPPVPDPGARSSIATSHEHVTANSDDRPPTLLYGTLRGPDGAPLKNLWSEGVSLVDELGRWRGADARDGTFAFGALPYGKYWLLAGGTGFRNLEELVVLDSERAQVKRDLVLRAAVQLRIRIATPEGDPWFDRRRPEVRVAGIALLPVATAERPGLWMASRNSYTNLNERFGIGAFTDYGPNVEALPRGYYGILTLDGDLPAFVSLVARDRVVETKRVEPGSEEVEFVLSVEAVKEMLATVRVQVVDAATGALIDRNGLRLGEMISPSHAEPDGSVSIGGYGPGDYDWIVSAPGYEMLKMKFHADPGNTVDLGKIALEPEIRVSGTVLDPAGRPCSERLRLGQLNPATGEVSYLRTDLDAGGDGKFELNGLGRRVYVLRAGVSDSLVDFSASDGWRASDPVLLDLRSGVAPRGLAVQLRTAMRMTIAVADRSLKYAPLVILDARGMQVTSNVVYGPQPRSFVLPPGEYRVQVLESGGKIALERKVQVASEPVTVELSR
jgi:RNA polymerase sigma-70 factor (ECF subfamily)